MDRARRKPKPSAAKFAMQTAGDYKWCADRLKALADPDRLRIVNHLLRGSKNVTDLADELDLPVVNVSHHLQVLRRVGMLEARKQGKFVIYSRPSRVRRPGRRPGHQVDRPGLLPPGDCPAGFENGSPDEMTAGANERPAQAEGRGGRHAVKRLREVFAHASPTCRSARRRHRLARPARLYAGRAVGRDRDHRRAGRAVVAGRPVCPRGGPARAVRQQSQADRRGRAALLFGPSEFSGGRRLEAAAGPADVLDVG